jgi:hypothetical protein
LDEYQPPPGVEVLQFNTPPLLSSSQPQSSSFANADVLPLRCMPPLPPTPLEHIVRWLGAAAGAVPVGMSVGQFHGRPSAAAVTIF